AAVPVELRRGRPAPGPVAAGRPGLPALGLLVLRRRLRRARGGLHRLLDASCTAADQPRTADAFDRSVRYEIAFWQMAYTRGASDRALPRRYPATAPMPGN